MTFFAESVLVDDVLVEAGTNVSIGCPGMTRNTFVVQLEWRCIGPCGSATGSKPVVDPNTDYSDDGDDGEASQVKLLKYVKDQETSVFAERIRLDKEMFSLQFDPVTDKDEGKYVCLINNRPLPDAVIKLNVLGKETSEFFEAVPSIAVLN